MSSLETLRASLLRPACLFAAGDLFSACDLPPARPGLYAWFFEVGPPGVPLAGVHRLRRDMLLYAGIAPSSVGSGRSLRVRLRGHFQGPTSESTLRRTLGALLAKTLGLAPARGSVGRLTFSEDGEARLSEWLANHTRVAWTEHPAPWEIEKAVMHGLCLPLKPDAGNAHPFHAELRRRQREFWARPGAVARRPASSRCGSAGSALALATTED